MSNGLSRITADLFSKPMEGNDLPSRIQQLNDEIKKAVQSGDTIYGKFRGLLESFLTIIPDEQQRYLAALQALSTTSKLGRQEIIRAINDQLEELKTVEQGLLPSLAGWRDGLKSMEIRSQAIKSEITQLRERIAQLENEERAISPGMAALAKDLGQAEKTIRDVFANINAEITAVNKKMAELPDEAPAAQPVPPAPQPIAQAAPVKSAAPVQQKVEINVAPAPKDTKWQKKCPMCGGQFSHLELQNLWQCYACGYEEPAADKV